MNTTIVTQLTGNGRAAVATVAIAGPQAFDFVQNRFERAGTRDFHPAINRIYFGRWNSENSCEELVVCQIAADELEVHCHGGITASRKIIKSLTELGAMEVSVDEWADRRQSDRFVIEAQRCLPFVQTERQLEIVLAQINGALRNKLLNSMELIRKGDSHTARIQLERMIQLSRAAACLRKPFRVVVVGEPNVGKSSLINAMVGYRRSIVFDQPGTTRDLVSVQTVIDGWPIELTDTAGIRSSQDQVERAGIQLAVEELKHADLVLSLFDLTAGQDHAARWDETNVRKLRVGTKRDLIDESSQPIDESSLRVSSKDKRGIEELMAEIVRALLPVIPTCEDAIALSEGTFHQIQYAFDAVTRGDNSEAIRILESLLARR